MRFYVGLFFSVTLFKECDVYQLIATHIHGNHSNLNVDLHIKQACVFIRLQKKSVATARVIRININHRHFSIARILLFTTPQGEVICRMRSLLFSGGAFKLIYLSDICSLQRQLVGSFRLRVMAPGGINRPAANYPRGPRVSSATAPKHETFRHLSKLHRQKHKR